MDRSEFVICGLYLNLTNEEYNDLLMYLASLDSVRYCENQAGEPGREH